MKKIITLVIFLSSISYAGTMIFQNGGAGTYKVNCNGNGSMFIGTPTPPTPPPPSGIVFISSVCYSGSTGGTSPSMDTTNANFLYRAVASLDGHANHTVTDSKSNVWTWLGATPGGSLPFEDVYYSSSPIVGTGHTFTTTTSGTEFIGDCIMAFSGMIPTASVYESSASIPSTGDTTPTAGPIIPGSGQQLIIASLSLFGDTPPLSIDSGFSSIASVSFGSGNNFGQGISYLIQVGSATVNPTWTYNGGGAAPINANFQGQ